ncbi:MULTISPECIES: PadR family transcriptional regulator [Acidithiobacillus]|nr:MULTISPECIES: PadR family transcriptional regulator [Acidithiobacillus]WMT47404.1 MAG: PadR family transcriptional regulator [Acidithiobacillus caldus]
MDSDPWSECSGKGCRQGRGGRRRRLLDQGMLRFVVLQELDREPCHGYELIKRLTERSGGIYSPSPGMIYPMLTMLEELGLVLVTESGNKRRYSLTDRGKDFLDENRALTQAVAERLEALAKDDWENMRRHLQGLRDAVHERVAVAHGQRQVVARLEEILENALKQVRNL